LEKRVQQGLGLIDQVHESGTSLASIRARRYSMSDMNDQRWNDEDTYWRDNYRHRPYASSGDRDYDYYRPAYRYGYDAASRYRDRSWNDVESDLSSGWSSYEDRGASTWEQMKDAVRDAWDRMTGRRTMGTQR
jgi:hypothetical protein